MNRVLLTGSSGFIGRHAVDELVRLGYEVHVTSRQNKSGLSGVISHQVDLLDARQTADLLRAIKPTHLIHFAWYVEHGKYRTSLSNLDWVAASVVLFKSFAENGGRRAVFAGTCAEYDWAQSPLYEDQTPNNPATLYGVCKNSLRQILQKTALQCEIEFAWSRIFFLYGPGEHPARLIPSILLPLLRGQPATVRAASHVRDLMHVKDVAAAFVAVLNSSLTGVVNIASGNSAALGDVARCIAELLNRSALLNIEQSASTSDNPLILTADVTKLRSIGFVPKYALREGLSTLIDPSSGI